MSQPSFQPADYSVPCPRCGTAVMLPRNAGARQRLTCAGCGATVASTWTDDTILLAAYPARLPRRDEIPPQGEPRAAGPREPRPPAPERPGGRVYPQTRMQPVFPPPPARVPEYRPGPRPEPAPVPVPEARHTDDFRPRRDPRQDDKPDWEGARRRVSRAMNGLR